MTVLDRPAARSIFPLRLVATVIAAFLFTAGWIAGVTATVVLWSVTAVRLGWDDARRPGGS